MPLTPSLEILHVCLFILDSALGLFASLPRTIIHFIIDDVELACFINVVHLLRLLRQAVGDREINPDIRASNALGRGEVEGVRENAARSRFKILPSLELMR